ncbi:uncharacterized protein LOC130688663 [Daphnia carinata]|uniref:uncharacterized protein LOC130688663 n=1 Tax=Daphnia carinata TaxID=120202 RepID=UPI00257BF720|nr:uncharacterized protein LOC130688663 [Daphnia carinata]
MMHTYLNYNRNFSYISSKNLLNDFKLQFSLDKSRFLKDWQFVLHGCARIQLGSEIWCLIRCLWIIHIAMWPSALKFLMVSAVSEQNWCFCQESSVSGSNTPGSSETNSCIVRN